MRTFLDAMVESESSLTWLSLDPKKLAYQIHEGLRAASALNFKTFAGLRGKWVIRYKDDRVIAELQAAPPIAGGKLALEGIFDPLDIVQEIIKHKSFDFELVFPDASMEEEDTEMVLMWCKDNDYSCTLDNGISVKKTQTNGNSQTDPS